ncbi:elongation factor 1-beta [Thermoplasma volcanium]|uniref:Elongation factor 1-beta n=1 Tax=Thermoplasma volcanium (strain ATCC 51530 / DSM 4299 / JCM 9571 / NBRC 15438 / GSS1) TaxID=273116 RepID=EF1B_THEVO|nr:elongation factor 1-beta [Thermoplasma volcanium]Q97B41.2 RecName: Full=Elongation factor 1-beta; Short=EF-1-beta; AltName: Full=aEF-1beta [Thermoplasma volcanium GSS1]
MADVLVSFKLLPSDSDVDTSVMESEVKEKLNGVCKINNIEEKDIGFGLKYIHLEVIVEDKEGEVDRIEKVLSMVKGVGEINTENVSLI